MDSLLNDDYIKSNITANGDTELPFLWTHGATSSHLGDGLLVYSLIQYLRAKVCVCLGSGGGFVPRLITQARYDLHRQNIFEGDNDLNWGDIGVTYLVDAANGVGGTPDYLETDSFFRSKFYPRLIIDTTEEAYYNFFVKEDIKIDFLFIDADHSYEGVKLDFELYSKLVKKTGIIALHDTDQNYHDNLIVTEDAKKDFYSFDGPAKFIKELGDEWKVFNLFNEGIQKNKPSSTGLTLVQHA
jgi:hypothetical protein